MPQTTRPVRTPSSLSFENANTTHVWTVLAVGLISFSAWLTYASKDFGYDTAVIDMPVISLVAVLVIAGLIYVAALPKLIRATIAQSAVNGGTKATFALIVLAGLTARLILFSSEPMLENDYHRYLWDGAVTANGINPYAKSPEAVEKGDAPADLITLKSKSGVVFDRINYKNLTTIYPPIAQAAFAIAHVIEPWQLWTWRAVILLSDLLILALLVALLHSAGRSHLWAALYWWNPLVLKELFNSAHMDGLVVMFLLAAVLATVKMRHVSASVTLACAVGAKLWPVLLAPLLWQNLKNQWKERSIAVLVFGGPVIAFAIPIIAARLDANTGLVAYAQSWKLNNPLFHGFEQSVAGALIVLGWGDTAQQTANLIAKLLIASGVSIVALALARTPSETIHDLMGRLLLVTAVFVFTTPAAYPWYVVWIIPFLAFHPSIGLATLTATMGLYYLRFYFSSRGDYETFNSLVSLFVWVPVWIICFWEFLAQHGKTRASKAI